MRARRRLVIAGSAGLLAGVVAGVFVWRAIAAGENATTTAATPAPTTAATTTTTPVWISPRETRIGPAVFLPLELEIEGGLLVLSYEMADLAPLGGRELDPAAPAPAAPAAFTLRWAGGEVSERVVAPSNRAVRFPIPEGFVIGTIQEITIDSYWMAAPMQLPIALPRDGGAWEPIGPGMGARIHQVVEQADDFLVIVELDGPGATMSHLAITGAAREWASASSSMLATPRWTLSYRGEALPEPIPLMVVGVEWIELEAAAPVEFAELIE
jgi:hypothetical protein